MDERLSLALIFLGAVVAGALLLWLGLSSILDMDHPLETQTVVVSATLAAESCPEAERVGDGACNAKVTVTDWTPFMAVALGGFMLVLGVFDVMLLVAVS